MGIYIGLLPCWGEYVIPREGRAIFNTTDQAYSYVIILAKDIMPREILYGFWEEIVCLMNG